ncbi:MAG: hypothetical protein ACXW02_06730 [Halobacteriota archaeon]
MDEGIILREKIEKNAKLGIQVGMPEHMARHMCFSSALLRIFELWQHLNRCWKSFSKSNT